MELSYESSADLSIAAQYNGNISATKWKTFGEASGAIGQRSYKYDYDRSDKLKQATFQAHDGSSWNKDVNTLNEGMNYDHNGNILGLTRKYKLDTLGTTSAAVLDGLTYTYASGHGNRMTSVEDSGTKGGFNNRDSHAAEYKYDTLGNLTVDKNKGISNITYNELGKVKQVTFTDGRWITYLYDAAGSKLRVKNHNGSATDSTDYVGGFVYQNSALSFFSSPEGRVVKNGNNLEYQYAISDHQGNTRVLFTSATPDPVVKTATFEGGTGDDSGEFLNVPTPFSYTAANHTTSGSKVIRMNQANPVGPSKSVKVYPGDKVDMEVYGYYDNTNGYGTGNSTASAMITAIAAAFGGVPGLGESGRIYDGVSSAIGGSGLGGNPGDTSPAAFINYILFDNNYRVKDMGWTRIPATAATKNQMTIPQVTVKEAGYIFVYLSYEDQSNNYVYFDDFKVTHTPSNLLQMSEYYPFGLQTANSWTRENALGNQFLNNGGTELNSTTSLYDLDFRNYDPILGRMNQMDPLVGKYASHSPYNFALNCPVSKNDPKGADVNVSDELWGMIMSAWNNAPTPYVNEGGGASGFAIGSLTNLGFSDGKLSSIEFNTVYTSYDRGTITVNHSTQEITVAKTFYVETEGDMAYSNRNIEKLNKIDDFLNSKNFKWTDGYSINFKINFIAGGKVLASDPRVIDGTSSDEPIRISGVNTFKRRDSSDPTWGNFFTEDKTGDTDNGFYKYKTRGGITTAIGDIIMNADQDTRRNRIHEIFHSFGVPSSEDDATQGIMAYPPRNATQDDIYLLLFHLQIKQDR